MKPAEPLVTTSAIETTYSLSPLQQGMLYDHLSHRPGDVNLEQIVGTVRHPLDVACFRRAWECMVARHPALRTGFRWTDVERPIQEVHSAVDMPFVEHDLRSWEPARQQAELASFLVADRRLGFDVAAAPLLRLTLFRLGAAESTFVWSFHHLLIDGRSIPVVLKEVFHACDAFANQRHPDLNPTGSYEQYVRWLAGRDRSRDMEFWRNLLGGVRAPTPLPAPLRVAAPASPDAGWSERELRLSSAITASLESSARRAGVTLSTMILGGWALLLGRYSGEDDVVFGATRACRRSVPDGADEVVGVFANALPVRVAVNHNADLPSWLREIRAQQLSVRPYEHTPLGDVQRCSEVPAGTPLFESLVTFDRNTLNAELQSQGGDWGRREVRRLERPHYPLTLHAYGEPDLLLKIAYDRARFEDGAVERMLQHLCTLLEGMAVTGLEQTVATVPMLSGGEQRRQLLDWNQTAAPYPRTRCLHQLIEQQADRTPEAVAVVCEGEEVTYGQLDARANRLARYLQARGVGPDALVGIHLERSVDMIVAVLATWKAGGAYVPLDPAYPERRLAFILDDAQVRVVLTQQALARALPAGDAAVITVDADRAAIDAESTERVQSAVTPANLAYVIYTSGSTGKPKGVMVEHRNVVNFCTGMDHRISHESGSVWLALTSLSFDISVLELFWTLTRGFATVVHVDRLRGAGSGAGRNRPAKTIEFSLFYFASDEGSQGSSQKYRLLTEGVKFADEHGFSAVWTPERHFHAFGGLYPNPSVTSAAIAALTTRVKIRAGSCVLPLHNPIRVAEEWSLIDNLSDGRVGISFASGWQPNDFALMPEHYANAKEIMVRDIGVVRRLWRGEAVAVPGPKGTVEVRTFPRPVQPELPFWITSAGSPETFRLAGEMGANVLTHLLGQSVAEVGERLQLYRTAWKQAGHAGNGHVTLMLHAFVADNEAFVRAQVHEPLKAYLRSAASLIKPFASAFSAFRKARGTAAATADVDFQTLGEEDLEALVEYAFARYYEASGLFGTPTSCLSMVDQVKEIGVDEIACLLDFGVPTDTVLTHLPYLNQLRERANMSVEATPASEQGSIAALIKRHAVTHLQCTPSLAATLTIDQETREALRGLRQFLVGGETLPTPLAAELRSLVGGDLINMYGPTETTIWSAAFQVTRPEGRVPIGRPIANTEFYVLDKHLRPTPIGVPGELYIGGEGVARGYLHRPELTAERFRPHPFRAGTGERVYRTGDLVRYRDDGAVEFLGRIDEQVKIRGHRIELGEIESTLTQHPGVREVVVVSREGGSGGAQLVAYYVPDERATPSPDDLKRHVMRELPEFMVPSAFVALPTLPRTPNGKVDRRALPATEEITAGATEAFVAPRTSTEEALAVIWIAVLGVDRVGVHDNFFELGGHSLATIQIAARVRRTFQVELPLQAVFEAPTVAQLAATIEGVLTVVRIPAAADQPQASNAKLGHDPDGQSAWFVPDPERPGKYRRVASA